MTPRLYRVVLEQLNPATLDDLPEDIRDGIARTLERLGLRPRRYPPLTIEVDRAHAIKVLGVIFDQLEQDTRDLEPGA